MLLWVRKTTASPFIFTNSFGRQWKTDALCKRLRKLRETAGYGPDVRLYGCRHLFLTQAAINGATQADLKELAGHRTLKSSERYVHLAGKEAHMFKAAENAVGRKPAS
jgi:site-specific recombinase XerD